MVRRKTMKHKRKTMKRDAKRSMSRVKRSRRKNRKTKRKMRWGGEGEVKEKIEEYERKILNNPKYILIDCLDACNALQPFIQTVYETLNKLPITDNEALAVYHKDGDLMKIMSAKSSATDVFTIADGMVQHILRKYLFNDPDNNKDFVGEEQVEVTEKDENNNKYIVKEKEKNIEIPHTFTKLIDDAIDKIKLLGNKMPENIFEKYTVFVDPIDGTAEFSGTDKRSKEEKEKEPWPIGGKGDQCTILIGFADKVGNAVAGLAYRPVINPNNTKITYAYGWMDENGKGHVNDFQKHLNMSDTISDKIRFITSNGSISNITSELIEKTGQRISSGGAGNKILMLLENKGDVYLQDRGVSRWDTCAGDAILEASGGRLSTLTNFLENKGDINERYIYKKLEDGENNTNPNEKAAITPYTNKYSNLCGLFAIKDKNDEERIKNIYESIVKVAEEHPENDKRRVENQIKENKEKNDKGGELTKDDLKKEKPDLNDKELFYFHFD